MCMSESKGIESSKNHKKKSQARTAREKNEARKSREKTIKQEFKNTKILPGDTILASPAKIRSTWILPESQDLFFQTRILYRRNGKRILAGNQEKKESGKNEAKIVDLCSYINSLY
jgi:hypothetical protein